MKDLSREKKRETKASLKKMLELLEPFLPPKPEATSKPCGDWQPTDTSIGESLLIGGGKRPKDRDSL